MIMLSTSTDSWLKERIGDYYLQDAKEKGTVHASYPVFYVYSHGNSDSPICFLKEVTNNDQADREIQMYRTLDLIRVQDFEVLALPRMLDFHKEQNDAVTKTYLLLDYQVGQTFNIARGGSTEPDESLARQMSTIVADLRSIDIEQLTPTFTHGFKLSGISATIERYARELVALNIIDDALATSCMRLGHTQSEAYRSQGLNLVFGNGDFNPRNIIRESDTRCVLVDWAGHEWPLEHYLVYPWLVMYRMPEWQLAYASIFEQRHYEGLNPVGIQLLLIHKLLEKIGDDHKAEPVHSQFHISLLRTVAEANGVTTLTNLSNIYTR